MKTKIMGGVDQYISARAEHIRRQFADGDSHGRYDGNGAVKREMAKLWDALSQEERREAEQRYSDEAWQQLRSTSR